MKMTDKQKKAVNIRNKDILISAAAGSGKTTVLTKRVCDLVLEGADITRMLICTYTRTAAAELKQRIFLSISQAADEANDIRLRNQSEKINTAMIGTIHSFCTQVIRENFLKAGLKVSWRTGETALCSKLKAQAADEAFYSLYEDDNEDILWLARRYGGRDDRRLKENVVAMYELSRSLKDGIAALKKQPEVYSELITQGEREFLGEIVRDMKCLLKRCYLVADINEDFDREIKNTDKISDFIKELEIYADGNDISGMLKAVREFKFPKLSAALKPKEASDEYKAYKENIKKLTEKLESTLASFLEVDLEEETEYMSRLNASIYTVLELFEKIYEDKKAQRGILDYDDLIHKAYALLSDKEIAEHYRSKIDYVFLDEFQDTNEIQDALIEKISSENGRFIVGDIKQSIYSFRLADPSVFINKMEMISENGEVIYMNDNFRSAPKIIDEINGIMEGLMTKEFGGVEYTGGERLNPGREMEGGSVRMLCAVTPVEGVTAEAEMITKKIEELLQQGYAPGEIAILVRKTSHVAQLSEALESSGIPSYFDGSISSPAEIDLFVEHLKLIDSENDDAALIAVMRSYAVGFNEEELAEIRCYSNEESFSKALRAYDADNELARRAKEFLLEIDRLRLFGRTMPVEELLWEVKSFTRFDEILPVLPGGEARYDSFTRFFDNMLEYAKEGNLYSLICALERIKEKSGSYIVNSDATVSENCVNIMTIHRSKGLQFRAVFLAQANLNFNFTDITKSMLIDRHWGAVSHILDAQNMRTIASRSKMLLAHKKRKEILSEELRVLYVALTRAEENLYITCSIKVKDKIKYILPTYATNYLGWLQEKLRGDTEYISAVKTREDEEKADVTLEELEEKLCDTEKAHILQYDVNRVPVKMGVSSLLSPYEKMQQRKPMVTQYPGQEPLKNSRGADFGTLIHSFFQYYDYKTMPTVEECLKMAREKELFTQDDCDTIRSFGRQIEGFLSTELVKRISNADEVLKELPFSIGVSARELGIASDDTVVIQGIIDLAIREADEYAIIDYKTNIVRDIAALKEHYSLQLAFYKRALQECRGAKVKECILCFLRTGDIVKV